MKRLIITGFGCPEKAWHALFPPAENQKILTLAEVLSNCSATDLRDVAKSVAPVIEAYQPDVVVMHDYGVFLGLMAFLELRRRRVKLPAKIIIFNGSFRGFNVLEARHPFKIQLASFKQLKAKFKQAGAELDDQLEPHLSRIKGFYRQIIMMSLVTLIKERFTKRKPLNIKLGSQILIIASSNDPFIPMHNLKQIAADFKGTQLEVQDYKHFPYSGNCKLLKERIDAFERAI